MSNRPVYETNRDREIESRVSELFAEAWGVDLVRLDRLAGADYLLVRDGQAKALAEIKTRGNPRGQYPTYMISAAKVYTLRAAAEVMKATPLLIVSWADDTGWINLASASGQVRFGGREDRNDSADMEPCLFIPTNSFRSIHVRN